MKDMKGNKSRSKICCEIKRKFTVPVYPDGL